MEMIAREHYYAMLLVLGLFAVSAIAATPLAFSRRPFNGFYRAIGLLIAAGALFAICALLNLVMYPPILL